MHKFAFRLWFIDMHVIIHGNNAANENSDVKGIIGAILDSSSRIGQKLWGGSDIRKEEGGLDNKPCFMCGIYVFVE